MFSFQKPQKGEFPELVGRNAQEAASYIASLGLKPEIMTPNQPATMDYRTDRVRIVVDPVRMVVIQKPTRG